MSRKMTIISIVLAAAVAFAAGIAYAVDAPAEFVIDKVAAKKSGVNLTHGKHAETIDCFKCHHKSTEQSQIKSCFECHGKDPAASDPTLSGKENPFHVQCTGCHKELGKGPAKCKECHP